jgi:ABC-2 type transport system permease protein
MAVDGQEPASAPTTIGLYYGLMLAGLRAKLNHRTDFLIMAGAALAMQALGYVFLWIVFRQIPSIAGWQLWELILVYAMVFMTEGFVSLLFEGLWRFNGILNRGEFDLFLTRPLSPILQILVYDVGLNGIGNIVLGGVMATQAILHVHLEWTPIRMIMVSILFVSAVLVRGATVLAAAALGFWTGSPQNSAMQLVHSIASFAQFPLSIYGRGLQALLTFGIPFAFISYYPAAWLFSKPGIGWIGLLTPVVAIHCLVAARWLFRHGVSRYQREGN